MAKVMTQLKLLTKHAMGGGLKRVNAISASGVFIHIILILRRCIMKKCNMFRTE